MTDTKTATKTPAQTAPAASTALATTTAAPLPARAVGGVIPWDPFTLMDRLDAQAFVAEMEGIASDELVYRIKGHDGKDTVGLSKGGVDECCTMLVSQGQCIREEDIKVEYIGDGDTKEAIFKCVASRYAVHPDGREVRLDSVIGVKREPLYEDRAPLTPQSKVPGKKWRHKTFAQIMEEGDPDGLSYLEWIRDASSFDEATKNFAAAMLAGVDVQEFAAGKRFNPFWFEHGAMKSARNARFRLIPAGLRAQVLAMANAAGRVKEVDMRAGAGAPAGVDPVQSTRDAMRKRETSARADDKKAEETEAQRAASTYPRRDASKPAFGYPFGPKKTVPLDAIFPAGHEHAGRYVIGEKLLARAYEWGDKYLREGIPQGEGQPTRPLTDEEKTRFEKLTLACLAESSARGDDTAGPGLGKEPPPAAKEGKQSSDPTPPSAPQSTSASATDGTTSGSASGASAGTATSSTADTGSTSSHGSHSTTRTVTSTAASDGTRTETAARKPSPVSNAMTTPGAPTCPDCGAAQMYDNRKENEEREAKGLKRRPDYKCKRRGCEGIIWDAPDAQQADAFGVDGKPEYVDGDDDFEGNGEDAGTLGDTDDDLPF